MNLLRPVVLAAVGACLSATAAAQGFPVKPIRIIVQFPAGNGADINARMLAQQLSLSLGQQVVVENRPGAAGVAAVQSVAKSDPDGYTLLHMANVNAISRSLFKTVPYDIVGQFTPVSTVSFTPMLFVTAKGSHHATFKDLLAAATANPSKFTLGIGQLGSTQHLVAELFKATLKQPVTIVPFNSAGNLLSAGSRGEVDVAIDLITPLLSPLKSGTYKALAISSDKRFSGLPDVPTLIESGFVDYPVQSWGMVGAPAKTPAAIVDRLSRESIAALAHPDIQKRAQDMGIRVAGSTPQEARDLLVSEIGRWRKIIQAAGIELQ